MGGAELVVSSLWGNLPSSQYTAMKDNCRQEKTEDSEETTHKINIVSEGKKAKNYSPVRDQVPEPGSLWKLELDCLFLSENVAAENFNGNH